jgi:predicted phage terminase large subunit-like protein
LIEDASTGTALATELQKAVPFVVKPVPVRLDKVDRLFEQQGKFASGRVHFPKDAPFLPELLRELLSFPQSKTTDQVDSISQALAYQGSDYTLDNVL